MKIGLTLPQAADYGEAESWAEIGRLARLAEEGGADSLWVADHLLYRDDNEESGIHESFTLLTAIAAVTTRVEIGPLVAATSFRSPGMLAKIATTLDFVSAGRLILGLGCGWHEPEYRAFGYPFDHRVGRFEEIVQAVRRLLDGERVSVDGRWMHLDDAVLVPQPERRIPIVIAAEGPRMMSITARVADGWQCGWSGLPDDGWRRESAVLREACEAVDRATPIEILKGVDVNDDFDDDPHLPLNAGAIAAGLAAWEAEGVDHVQLRMLPTTRATIEVGLHGIRRYRAAFRATAR
jgi:alkanesulfonate monooxygenase SsuD/methylene tetrahydromethanopterin reductase-like flavin-dependent oxidoreductase (luciferase family)